MRRLGRLAKRIYPKEYGGTLTHFETDQPVIALTIDDGLSRGGPETSMANDVLELLAKYDNAHATFFVCSDYVTNQEDSVIEKLLDEGHEVGNHMISDRLFYYNKLDKPEFQTQMRQANAVLDDLEEKHGKQNAKKTKKTRWFRAPQGLMSANMKQAMEEEGNMEHVLGDCYCDDWSFAQEADPLFAAELDGDADPKLQKYREKAMKQVSNLMLSQVKAGSIAIIHMPEKGFREGNLMALEFFLQGIQKRGLRCCNLTEMQQMSQLDEEEETKDNTSKDSGNNDTINEESTLSS
eukprot:Sro277_g106240.2  (294) ;mRNA; r:26261-27142